MRYGIRWFKCKLKPPKNAKTPNSHVRWVGWQPTFDAEFKFSKIKFFYRGFFWKFSKFSGKKVPGMRLAAQLQVARYTKYTQTTIKETQGMFELFS